ncbi:MAG: ferritin-like domain-containing protein [Actinomycetota bacterium]|nr:ferritin-like domain-containing protein [Actinomycetota bacterium]
MIINRKLAASPELATVEVHGMTRGAFILRAALAAGSVYGLQTVTPFVSEALAQDEAGDLEILNFALTLEFLETDFYENAQGLSGEVADLARTFGGEEAEHVAALTAAIEELGGKPASKPVTSFPKGDEAAFLKLAQTLEDTGVSAYNGAAPLIESKEILAAAGSIVQIEARHAATIRMLNGENPAPVAFDQTLQADEVLSAVEPFVGT